MSRMSLPGFTGEASLYTSTNGYVVASNGTTGGIGAVVPAQRTMGDTSIGYDSTPGVVFLSKRICWDPTGSSWKFGPYTFQKSCQICQWFVWARVCPSPPACHWGWVAEGEATRECTDTLVQIG